jgi:hypothetical protein
MGIKNVSDVYLRWDYLGTVSTNVRHLIIAKAFTAFKESPTSNYSHL